jgi:lambda repressor-like predicted transcriptional regulator
MRDFPIILTEGGPDMKRKYYTEEKIISILKVHENGSSMPDLSRRHGMAENTSTTGSLSSAAWRSTRPNGLRELEQ